MLPQYRYIEKQDGKQIYLLKKYILFILNFWIQREQELAEGRRRANFIVTSGAFTLILLAAFLGFTLGQCMKCIGLIKYHQ